MAARSAAKVFDWAKLATRIPQAARGELAALRTQYNAIQTSLDATPAEPAAIDWEGYRKRIRAPGYVDSVKATYEGIKHTYPADTTSASIKANETAAVEKAAALKKQIEATIADLQTQLAEAKAEKPLDEVTVDEFLDSKKTWKKEFESETEKHSYL